MFVTTNSEKALPLWIEQQHDPSNLAVVHSQPKWRNNTPFDDSTANTYVLDMKHRDNQSSPASPHSQSSGPNNCALRGMPHKKDHASGLANHSWEYCQERFLRWVAYERLFDTSILREERFTCPLLWCRRRFDDPRRLLEHVLVCDRLREGEYWCPEHQAPERFTSPIAAKYRSSLKLSVCLRHAVRIIRRLGSRRSKNIRPFELEAHQVPQPSNDHMWIEAENGMMSKRERAGAELSTTRSCELKIELPTTVSRCYELQSPILSSHIPGLPFTSSDAMEVDGPEDSSSASSRSISPIDEGYDVVSSNASSPMSPCYTINTSPQAICNDDPFGSDMASPVFFPVPMFDLGPTNYDVVFASHDIPSTTQGLRESVATVTSQAVKALKLDLPISFEGESNLHQGYSDEKIICHVQDSTRTDQQDSGDLPNEDHLSGPQPVIINNVCCRENVTGADVQMRSQRDLIEGLRHVSPMLYKRSLRNLRRDPITAAVRSFIDNMPLPENIIALGLGTLRKVFSATLPNKLMDIYAMLHVAYVVAIVINQKDVTEVQRDLYADILNWSLAIKSIDERALFVNIAQLMWASDYSKMNCPRFVNDVLSGTLNQTCFTTVLPPISELPASHLGSDNHSRAFVSSKAYSNDNTALFQALKGGTAVYLCKQYLDVFEYMGLLTNSHSIHLQRMQERSHATPITNTSDYAEYWESMVTRPLLEFMGLEGFCSIVVNVQRMLGRGAFGALREAELKLIFDGQHYSRSPAKYHVFLKEVRRLCSQAITFTAQEPFSHDNQYKRDIDTALALLHASKRREESVSLSSSIASNSTSSSGRMTNKDLPPLVTDSKAMSPPSSSSKASYSSSSSARTVPSASSGQSGFSTGSAM
ncbi:hypothetical protein MMC18_008886 [Xylographa bjoerkii]|nr:hypothetical protein [Xylographa bjoerkii]MCJ1395991.1 hypothetical protein [Xylographa bjoerkii]MCJ1396000.1 hypothetical protein [Xylographa bjoerkii]